MKNLLVLFSALVIVVSCKEGPSKDAAADKSSAVCIWDKASLNDKPGKSGKWLSSISLGEKLTYLSESEETEGKKKVKYTKVMLGDGKEGWVRSEFVAKGSLVAVVTSKTDIYSRPDLSTVSKNAFEPMDIIAVKSTQDDWTEVIGKRQAGKWIETAWIKSANLSYEEKDVAVALYARRALAKPKVEDKVAELTKIGEISDLRGSAFAADIAAKIDELTMEANPMMDDIGPVDDETIDTAAGD